MGKTIPQLPPLSTVADNDLLMVEDVSAGATKKISRHDFLLGVSVQSAAAEFTEVATGTTLMVDDDSIPQNTEGNEFMTLAFTPRYAGSTLEIEALIAVSHSVAADLIAALFVDATANALAVADHYQATATGMVMLKLTKRVAASSTTERTYKVRVGGDAAGTTTFNGSATNRRFGGIAKSSIKVTEYAG